MIYGCSWFLLLELAGLLMPLVSGELIDLTYPFRNDWSQNWIGSLPYTKTIVKQGYTNEGYW